VDKAIADFEAALKRPDPDSKARANTLAALAAARQYKGDTPGALTAYDAAIAEAPDEAQLYLSRGALRNSLGQKDGALADYSKAIALRPDFGDAYLARGQLYAEDRDSEKAVKDLRLALQYANDDPTRTLAKKRLSELGATTAAVPTSHARIYIQIVDPKDMNAAVAVKRALEEQGYRVERIEPLPGRRTNGDVRYSTAADQAAAERVARSVETVLARQGYQVTMRTFELDSEKFPNAKPDVLEVWIPRLSRGMLQVPAKY
jgi:tetratricopeptide (TPR) repeat protein